MSELETILTAERLATLVDEWHFGAFHGSIVARDTEIWNLVHTAKEELKLRLAGMLENSEFLNEQRSSADARSAIGHE